jgi:uncharacterized protein YhbP (UPF0306 family)
MNATIRTTCTDADTRSAYAALLNAQIATQVAGQTRTMGKVATALNDYRGKAARATAQCRRYSKSRTGHRPNVTVVGF